jgi:YVTN family beta-propeller protein
MKQENRTERAARRAQRRRRAAVIVASVVLILAAASYGTYHLAVKDSTGSVGAALSTTSGEAIGDASSTGSSMASNSSDATTNVTVNGNTTRTTLANSAPQKLDITANPEFVKLAITLQDGGVITGKTPFSQEVPGGRIRIEFSKNGYNSTTRELTLDQPTAFKIWLDLEGQLYQSLVRFKCGPNPKQVAFSPDGAEMWTSLLGGYGLEIYEPTTGKKLGSIKLGEHGAVEVIFTRDGKTVYASQMETASVYEIDRETRTVKRHFETGGCWTKVLLLSPDEKTLWASNWVSNDVSEIDLETGKLVRRIPTVVTPRGLYVTPDGSRLYVAGFENGDIQRIDLATGEGRVIFETGARCGIWWPMMQPVFCMSTTCRPRRCT